MLDFPSSPAHARPRDHTGPALPGRWKGHGTKLLQVTVISRALLREHEHDPQYDGPSPIPPYKVSTFRWDWIPYAVDLALHCWQDPDLEQLGGDMPKCLAGRRESKVEFGVENRPTLAPPQPILVLFPPVWRRTSLREHTSRPTQGDPGAPAPAQVVNCFELVAQDIPADTDTDSNVSSVEGGKHLATLRNTLQALTRVAPYALASPTAEYPSLCQPRQRW